MVMFSLEVIFPCSVKLARYCFILFSVLCRFWIFLFSPSLCVSVSAFLVFFAAALFFFSFFVMRFLFLSVRGFACFLLSGDCFPCVGAVIWFVSG